MAATGVRVTCTMFRGVYDFLTGKPMGLQTQEPSYTITRLIGGGRGLPSGEPVVKHLFTVTESTDFIHFRAAYLLEMLGEPVLQRHLERILRDYMRFSKIRERVVIVRIGSWWGEFTVTANPPEAGTLILESR